MFPSRTKVILALACCIGVAAGVLTYLASHSVPQALLAAGAAVGSSVGLLLQVTATSPKRHASDKKTDKDDQDHMAEQPKA